MPALTYSFWWASASTVPCTRRLAARYRARNKYFEASGGIMEFYSVRKRQKVNVPDDNLKKTSFKARGATRYAVRAVDDDGTKLTKFVNKQTWDSLNVPEEK